MEHLRVYEAQTNKIHRDLHADTAVSNITDWVTVYAEIIPEEEREEEQVNLVNVYHFDKEPNRTHGVPFKLLLKPVRTSLWVGVLRPLTIAQGEMFSDTKERLSRRTGIKGKQLEKLKFAAVSRSSWTRPEYLEDGRYPVVADLSSDLVDIYLQMMCFQINLSPGKTCSDLITRTRQEHMEARTTR